MKKTPLLAEHERLGATLIDFHGWEMPVRYGNIPAEHAQVRQRSGLFDLCHMGRLELHGPDAATWLDRVLSSEVASMDVGEARYGLILNPQGTIIDDAIAYRLDDRLLLVVNASNLARVAAWIAEHKAASNATLIDRSDELAMIAVQGPESVQVLPRVVDRLAADWSALSYYSIAPATVCGGDAWIARTGYTGEDGFEVYLAAESAAEFWRRLLEAGGDAIAPIGLGARDTLRLEAAMPLYGNDIDETTDPYEAGLGFAVRLGKKPGFVGQEALSAKRASGAPKRRLRGFRVLSRRAARQGMQIFAAEAGAAAAAGNAPPVGEITSGAPSPTLGFPIALGYLSTTVELSAPLCVDVRGRREALEVTPRPFYSQVRKKKSL